MTFSELRLAEALKNLRKATREYIAEGIPAVDEAIHAADVALSILARIEAARKRELSKEPEEENLGGHWR